MEVYKFHVKHKYKTRNKNLLIKLLNLKMICTLLMDRRWVASINSH